MGSLFLHHVHQVVKDVGLHKATEHTTLRFIVLSKVMDRLFVHHVVKDVRSPEKNTQHCVKFITFSEVTDSLFLHHVHQVVIDVGSP